MARKKRIVVNSEFRATAEIDQGKLGRYYGNDIPGDAQLENSLGRSIEDGDITVRGILESFGVQDTVEPHSGAICEVRIEEECEHHPGEWASHNGRCLKCISEGGHRRNGSGHP